MRERNSASKRTYEFRDGTVLVRPPLAGILDGIVKSRFYCEVHPADGGPTHKFLKVPAFYSWQAANIAIEQYRSLRQ